MSILSRRGPTPRALTRRRLLSGGAAAAGVAAVGVYASHAFGGSASTERFEVTHTDQEWRQRLRPEQYAVLRQADTESPFTSPLNDEHRNGVFGCAGCELDLYSSRTKFDSGTGWPSFWQALPDAVIRRTDLALIVPRTEVRCRRCGGHLGHVFDDGPKPTGLRYCMNGVGLTFRTV